MNPGLESTKPSVSKCRCLSCAPDLLVAVEAPLGSPPNPVILVDWESAIPTLGGGFLPKRVRKRSRGEELTRSKVTAGDTASAPVARNVLDLRSQVPFSPPEGCGSLVHAPHFLIEPRGTSTAETGGLFEDGGDDLAILARPSGRSV